MKIFFVYPRARGKLDKNFQLGKAPASIFYGLAELRAKKIASSYSDRAFSLWNILYWLFLPIQKVIIKFTGLGFKLDQALLLLSEINASDITISTSDSSGLPIALLKKIGLVKAKHIYISVGLAGQYRAYKDNLIFTFYRWILSSTDHFICFSPAEKKVLQSKFNIDETRITFFPFCVDTNFFKPGGEKRTSEVLVVGRDLGRDYLTLSRAAKRMPDQGFILVCSPKNVSGIHFSPNVQVRYDINYDSLRELYHRCAMLVLPLKETERASGQIVMLEALASNLPLIVSAVKGITQVYELQNQKNCLFVRTQNDRDIVSAVQQLTKNEKMSQRLAFTGRKLVLRQYNQQVFSLKLLSIIKKVTSNEL